MSILSYNSLIFFPLALSTPIYSTRALFYCSSDRMSIYVDSEPPILETVAPVPLNGLVDDLFMSN